MQSSIDSGMEDYIQPSISHKAARRMMRYKVAGGALDFLGIAGCAFLILAMSVLLVRLVTWVSADLTQTFSNHFQSVTDAVVMGK